jgi:methylation protein EvaC
MIKHCSACGFDSLVDFFNLGFIPVCDDFRLDEHESLNLRRVPLSTLLCRNCFHFELNHKEDCRDLYSNYLYRSSHSSDLDSHFTNYVNYLKSLFPAGLSSLSAPVLDVGCNDGILLRKIGEIFGATELYGVDPSPACLEVGNNIRVFQDFFSSDLIRRENFAQKFELIVSNNTFANIEDITTFFSCLKNCLSKDGFLIIETGYGPLTLINEVWDMVNHEHYHYFSLKSLEALAYRNNMRLVDASIVETKGGSIRAVFCNFNSKANVRMSEFGSLATLERLMFRFPNVIIERINYRLQALRADAQALLRSHSDLALIGASAGGTILVHLLGFDKTKVILLDDNASRHGRYLPGTSIRVRPFDDVVNFENLVIINLAWRFSEDILERHPKLRECESLLLGNTLAQAFV